MPAAKKGKLRKARGLSGLPEEHVAQADTLFREAQQLRKLQGCSAAIESAQKMDSAAQEASWAWGAKSPMTKAIQREANLSRSMAVKKCGCS